MKNYLIAIKASIDAGNEILKVYNSDNFNVEIKKDKSPLTRADKNAHNKIAEYLNKTDIPVLSEEGRDIPHAERKKWHKLWIVDPLDGTKEFIKRNDEFTVNIALIENHNPVFGVIFVPVTGDLYFGIGNVGAYRLNISDIDIFTIDNVDKIIEKSVRLPQKSERPFTVVASRSHLSPETEQFINKLKSENPDLVSISRGSSLKLCAVAEGSADIYPRFAPTMEWDTAAGQAIVEAAGRTVTQVSGEPVVYNKQNLLNPWFIVK
jgi:3'(2'), 5'-bisphosphate nucleotidase